jgi:hypothetical protein
MQPRPANWDTGPAIFALEIKRLLESIKDEGSEIDSGMGDGCGDLWVKCGGVEYFISFRKSNNQMAKEASV